MFCYIRPFLAGLGQKSGLLYMLAIPLQEMINFNTFQDLKSLFQSVWKFWPPPDDLYFMRNGKVSSPYCLWHQGQCLKGLHPPWKSEPYLNDLSSMQNEKLSDPYYLFYWDQSSIWLHFPLKSLPHLYNHESKPDGNM